MAYLRDAGATLAAFADAFPPAAALVLAGGDGAMLGALAGLHDALVPQLLSLARKAAMPELGAQVLALSLMQKIIHISSTDEWADKVLRDGKRGEDMALWVAWGAVAWRGGVEGVSASQPRHLFGKGVRVAVLDRLPRAPCMCPCSILWKAA